MTHQNKVRSNKTERLSLAEQLRALRQQEGLLATKRPEPVRRHKRKLTQNIDALGWEQDDIGKLSADVKEVPCTNLKTEGPFSYAELNFGERRPNKLTVRFQMQVPETALVYVVNNGNEIKRVEGSLPNLVIPVTWNKDKPELRQKDRDNCDIIFVNDVGQFVVFQASVTVRPDGNSWKVYLNLQELNSGQFGRTTPAQAKRLGLTYVKLSETTAIITAAPLFAYHNRPKADWLGMVNVSDYAREMIVPEVFEKGRTVQLSQIACEDWEEVDLTPGENGELYGQVLFYNAVWNGGSGMILTHEGQVIFVHWRQLRGAYVLQPMSVVKYTPGEHQGKVQAQNVRPVKR